MKTYHIQLTEEEAAAFESVLAMSGTGIKPEAWIEYAVTSAVDSAARDWDYRECMRENAQERMQQAANG